MKRAGESPDRPDAGVTPVDGEFEDAVRRALHAAAESVEPAQDGLSRIRQRLAAPWLVRQVSLLATDCADLARLITIRLEPAFTTAGSCLAAISSALHRIRRRLMPRRRPAMAWLRPAVAVTGIAITMVIAAAALRQAVATITFEAGTGASTSAPASARPGEPGHGQSPPPSVTPASPGKPHTQPGSTPSCPPARCSPIPAAAPTATPGPAITPSVPSSPSLSQSPAPTTRSSHRHYPPHPHPTNARSHGPGISPST